MIEELQNERPEPRRLQDFDELRDHAIVVDGVAYLCVEGEIEEEAKSDLQEKLVIAGDEAIELLDDVALFHLNFVLAEDA